MDPITVALAAIALYRLHQRGAGVTPTLPSQAVQTSAAPPPALPPPPIRTLPATPSQAPFPQAAPIPAPPAPPLAPTPVQPPAPPLAPKPSLSLGPPPTIRRGSSGAPVEHVQRLLGITADGKFGPGTDAAVRAFQRSRGLAADGIVGPSTWAALGVTDGAQIPGYHPGTKKAIEVFRPDTATAALPRDKALQRFPIGFVPSHPPTPAEVAFAQKLLPQWREGGKWFEGSGSALRVYIAKRH